MRVHFVQFRLAALIVFAAACVVVASMLWIRWIAPNLTGYELQDGRLILHLRDEIGQAILPNDPYFQELANSPDVYVHDTYLAIPLWGLAIVISFSVAIAIGMFWCLCRLASTFLRRS